MGVPRSKHKTYSSTPPLSVQGNDEHVPVDGVNKTLDGLFSECVGTVVLVMDWRCSRFAGSHMLAVGCRALT